MDQFVAEAFARDWIEAWCERDIDSIVEHYAPEARFVSPVAAERTGDPIVVGRESLAEYWSGVHEYDSFQFSLDRVIWDDRDSELVIVYDRTIDGRHDRACELLRFDEDGLVEEGEAMYGAAAIDTK